MSLSQSYERKNKTGLYPTIYRTKIITSPLEVFHKIYDL